MMINVDFGGQRQNNGQILPRPKASVVNLSGESLRRHQAFMESKHQAMKYKADLDAALRTIADANAALSASKEELASANEEIDKLKCQIKHLQDELDRERAKAPKQKKGQKSKKDESAEVQPADIAEDVRV